METLDLTEYQSWACGHQQALEDIRDYEQGHKYWKSHNCYVYMHQNRLFTFTKDHGGTWRSFEVEYADHRLYSPITRQDFINDLGQSFLGLLDELVCEA